MVGNGEGNGKQNEKGDGNDRIPIQRSCQLLANQRLTVSAGSTRSTSGHLSIGNRKSLCPRLRKTEDRPGSCIKSKQLQLGVP